MVSLFRIRVDASQAKAELASLTAVHRASTAGIQAAWGGVNKMFIAGAAGIAAMGGAFAVAYLANKDFNKSMVHTAALADLNKTQMLELSDQVLGLGIKYGESSNIIADGLVILAKAGLTQQEIMTAMPTIVQLMKANAVDFEMAANIAMMTMNAFSIEYDQLATVGDKAQKAFQATLMDIEDLQQGLQYAASTAAMAGVPFESLLAMMGTLADNAMVAGIASRSMNKMLLDIVMHTDQVQQWADSMGLGVQVIKEGKLNIDEIIPAFAKLGMSLETLIESSDIFTVRALRSWGILIGHADEYDTLLRQINASGGTLAGVVEMQVTSLSSMMAIMKETLFAPFRSEAFGDEMTKIMKNLQTVVEGLAPALANLVFNLMKNFADILPDLVALLNGFLVTMNNLLPVIVYLGRAVAGIPPFLLKMIIFWKILQRMKIYDLLMNMTFGLEQQRVALGTLKKQEDINIATKQLHAQASRQLFSAMMGIGFGLYMMLRGYNKETRMLGAVTTAVLAAAAAYQILSMWKAASNPLSAPFRIGAALAVGGAALGVGAAIAYTMPDRNPADEIKIPKGGMFEPPSAQGGMRVVGGRGPQMVMAHPGEQISSANKEATGGGAIIEIRDSYFFDWDSFVKKMREDIGVENIKEIRRYR